MYTLNDILSIYENKYLIIRYGTKECLKEDMVYCQPVSGTTITSGLNRELYGNGRYIDDGLAVIYHPYTPTYLYASRMLLHLIHITYQILILMSKLKGFILNRNILI